jgi:hypothetical protein
MDEIPEILNDEKIIIIKKIQIINFMKNLHTKFTTN